MYLEIFIIFVAALTAHSGKTSDSMLESFRGEDCYRDCDKTSPRVCYFHWHLEHYHVLGPACGSCGQEKGNATDCFNIQCITADGLQRGVMSINRKIPGPSIHVCQNDKIVVDVTNKMGGTGVAIHWHGFHQKKTPFYDGVPFITQCPIETGTTFRYDFLAENIGTQFYHSHSGHHKINGHYGGIVVRQPRLEDPNSKFYDFDLKEHLIVASDWMDDYGEMLMPGLSNHPVGIQPTNVLINGKGTRHNKTTGRPTNTPIEVFRIQRGQRYRFRFVNSMSHVCPAVLEIENHSLLVIATDSYDLQPVTVDSLVSTSGERYDFVVNASQPGENYWIRLRLVGACGERELQQVAVLSYETKTINLLDLSFPKRDYPKFSDTFGSGVFLNHPNATCLNHSKNGSISYCISDLSSLTNRTEIRNIEPDHRFSLIFGNFNESPQNVFAENTYNHFMNVKDKLLVGVINNISFAFPPFPLLTQPKDIREDLFCDEKHKLSECSNGKRCHCLHRLKVKKNSIVEITVIDAAEEANNLNHPFHLHGFPLVVTSMGQFPNGTSIANKLPHKLIKANKIQNLVYKDTLSVPSNGFVVFRFRADNPGWWLLHCHFEWHLSVGMGLVVQVGETNEMLRPPKGFPKCGDFKPSVDFSIYKGR